MNSAGEPFFSWTSRRVVLPRTLTLINPSTDGCAPGRSRVSIDVLLPLGAHQGRLLAYRAADCETEYVALMVGQIVGSEDIPVRVVDEESLLIEGSRSTLAAEILIGARAVGSGLGVRPLNQHDVDSQLCMGGPIRDMLGLSGAVSVASEWCGATSPCAAA